MQAGLIGQALITGSLNWWIAAVVWLVLFFGGLSFWKGKPLTVARG